MKKEINVIIETERMILRPWTESDAEEMYKYAKDPAVGPIAGWPPHKSINESKEVINTILSAPHKYAMVLKETELPVGCIGIKLGSQTKLTDRNDECEFGYWLGVPYWGKGLMPEAVKALISLCFNELGMNKIWCGYYDGNEKSRRVQKKCGFKYHHKEESSFVPLMNENRILHVTCLERKKYKP